MHSAHHPAWRTDAHAPSSWSNEGTCAPCAKRQYKMPGGDEVIQTETWLVTEGDNDSSQLVEFIAACQAINAIPTNTDSWVVAQSLVNWVGKC